jgi:hypothetical protein
MKTEDKLEEKAKVRQNHSQKELRKKHKTNKTALI